jgi:hypothetical protein
MLRKTALGLLFLLFVVVSQVSAAGPVKFALAPTDGSDAAGTLRFVNGKPTDDVCSFHLSLTGLEPCGTYELRVFEPGGYKWSLWFFADDSGSCTEKGTTPSQVLSATQAEVQGGGEWAVVMTGTAQ